MRQDFSCRRARSLGAEVGNNERNAELCSEAGGSKSTRDVSGVEERAPPHDVLS